MSSTLGAYIYVFCSFSSVPRYLQLGFNIYCIYFILNLFDILGMLEVILLIPKNKTGLIMDPLFVRERSTIPNMLNNSLFDKFWEFKTWEPDNLSIE
jgi:hypothetical protein